MKYLIVLVLIALSIKVIAQSVELPHDSLIKKHHVKTITCYFHEDSVNTELDMVYKFDRDGRLISSQLFDSEDSTLDMELYFYENNLLKEHWSIGTWNTYDTVKITYSYNHNNQITKKEVEGKSNKFDDVINYKYLGDTTLLKICTSQRNNYYNSGIDSVIFNQDKTIEYVFNRNRDYKKSYKYNEHKQLEFIQNGLMTDTNIVYRYNKFYYQNGRLTKEVGGASYNGTKENMNESIYLYFYNELGLLLKIQRELNYDTFEYEFYE